MLVFPQECILRENPQAAASSRVRLSKQQGHKAAGSQSSRVRLSKAAEAAEKQQGQTFKFQFAKKQQKKQQGQSSRAAGSDFQISICQKAAGSKQQGQTFKFQFAKKQQGQSSRVRLSNFKQQGHKQQGQTFKFQFAKKQQKNQQKAAGSDFQISIKSSRVKKQQGQTFKFQLKAAGSDFQISICQKLKSSRVRLSNFNLPEAEMSEAAAKQQGQTFKFQLKAAGSKAAGSDFQISICQKQSSRVRLSNFNLPKSSRKTGKKQQKQQGQTFKFQFARS
jgi:hypothetical protein